MDEKLKKKILSEMESIIGNRCYNGNIQNWGAGGEWLGEGREFRYPIIFLEKDLKKDKCWHSDPSMSIQRMRTGHYAFGANRLYIIQVTISINSYLALQLMTNRSSCSNDVLDIFVFCFKCVYFPC